MKQKYLYIVGLVCLSACTDGEPDMRTVNGNTPVLSAISEQIVTRSGEVTGQFAEGTKYRLYAIKDGDWTASNRALNGIEGTEQDDHTIDYGEALVFGNSTMDFYGLTYGTSASLPAATEMNNKPTFVIQQDESGSLPDLRRATLPGQKREDSGVLVLPFKHTMAKLTFEVVRLNKKTGEVTGPDPLSSVKLTGISIQDYTQGTLDLETGKWTLEKEHLPGNETQYRQLGITPTEVTTENVTVKASDGSAPAEMLIFPTKEPATERLKIRVTTQNPTIEQTYEIGTPKVDEKGNIMKDDQGNILYEPYIFRANYKYTLTITIINDNVQILTVMPRKYDWIDVEHTGEYLGQPVNFGDVMWMDRNLGAKSADPSTPESWEDCRGYYYQFGRSIPFYFKRTVPFIGSDGKTYYRPKCEGGEGEVVYPYVEGKKDMAPAGISDGVHNLGGWAYTLQDAKEKDCRYISVVNWRGSNALDWDYNHQVSQTNWNDVKNQPCPKGWRLPTYEDFLSVFPIDELAGDITFIKTTEHQNATLCTVEKENDPATGYKSVYILHRNTVHDKWGTIYAIKNQGTSRAYRIMWQPQSPIGEDNVADEKGKVRHRGNLYVAKFPCSSDNQLTENNFTSYDWEHPSEVLNFPVVGYVHGKTGSMCYSGVEVVMATGMSNAYQSRCFSARIKFDGDEISRYIYMYKDDRRAHAFQVRCVRDLSSIK